MRRSKYNAKPTTVDGIRFASLKEARRYQELRMLEKIKRIRNLRLQPKFPLHTWTEKVGAVVDKIGEYRADFAYDEIEIDEGGFSGRWRPVVEDVKGFKTPLYKWKKRHVEAQYGIEIREI